MEIANDPPSPRELQAIQAECTRYLYVFVRYGQLFALGGAAMIAGLLWQHTADEASIDAAASAARRTNLVMWVVSLAGLVAWQQACGQAYRRATSEKSRRAVWRHLLILELGAVSALWGALAAFMLPSDPMYQMVVLMAIAMLTNGALPNLAVDRAVCYAWVVPQMLALTVVYAVRDDSASRVVAAGLCLDVFYMAWVQHEVRQNFIQRTLALLRNEQLVRQVQGAQVALTASLSEQKAIFDLAMVGIAEIRGGLLKRCNTQLTQMLGYGVGELTRISTEILRPAGAEGFAFTAAATALANGVPFAADLPVRRKDGSTLWVQLSSRPVHAGDPSQGHIAVFNDISDRLLREAAARRLAYEDALTGLPNRRLLQERAGVALARSPNGSSNIALLLIDLDGFKKVNDRHGHEAGDRVLTMAAQRLQACVREVDTVCRLGGDEFVVLLEEPSGPEHATRVAQAIIASVSAPIDSGCGPVTVGASVGIAIAPHAGREVEALLCAADEAMYRAKQAGRGTWRMHAFRPADPPPAQSSAASASAGNSTLVKPKRLKSRMRIG